jgi:hypothetical protein
LCRRTSAEASSTRSTSTRLFSTATMTALRPYIDVIRISLLHITHLAA